MNDGLGPRKQGMLATWWDATFTPSYLAVSLAEREPRVHPIAYASAAIAAGFAIAVAVTRVQLTLQLETFGAADALPTIEPFVLAQRLAYFLLLVVAMAVAVVLFALSAKLPLRDVFRARAYTLGPICHLYAWWTMYRWLREVNPGARRPEAWALMSFTVEWGLTFVLADYFGLPLRDLVLDFVPRF